MNILNKHVKNTLLIGSVVALTACNGASVKSDDINQDDNLFSFVVVEGTDLNSKSSELLSLNPAGPGGSPNQSLRSGDVLDSGDNKYTVQIGGLGVDVLMGNDGKDILIGGTEDFNSSVDGDDKGADNRDRAFGNGGDDVFIWAPGDGSDYFDGGDGTDVLVFGVIGEQQDSDGSTEGAPFFNVNPPSKEGSQDFDGIFLNERNMPIVDVTNSPGYCRVLEAADNPDEFVLLDIDHIIRFSLTAVKDAFIAGERSDDDGLRVAITAKNVEYLVCTGRDGGVIDVLDLKTSPASLADLSDLPEYVAELIQ